MAVERQEVFLDASDLKPMRLPWKERRRREMHLAAAVFTTAFLS
jgi:hypothetical protein